MKKAVAKAAATAIAYRAVGWKSGIVSNDVNTKVSILRPPPMPTMRPPTTQPVSMSG